LAENDFRSYRGRQPERGGTAAGGGYDPLAELARLIGQSDPYAERQYDAQARRHPAEAEQASGDEWADEEAIEQAYAAKRRYAEQPAALPPAQLDYVAETDEYDQEAEAVDQYYSGPSDPYVGYQHADETQSLHKQPQSAGLLPALGIVTSAPNDNPEFAEPEHDADDAYAPEEYYQPSRQRRDGLVLVMAVLGLAVVGTGGTFAYRTTFGGSLLPTSPIIKASSAPKKVMPKAAESQAANSSPAGARNIADLVSREEEPIDIEEAKTAPRVVSTIPVTSRESPPLPPSVVATITAMATNPNWPPAPAVAPPVATAPVPPSLPVNTVATPPLPRPRPSPPAEPKKIHTVTIRPDHGGTDATPAAPASRSTARGVARANSVHENAPLALVPAGEEGTPARSRRAPSSMSVASVAMTNANPRETRSAAGYAVQVSSQHSESEAQSSFQALRAKYPDLLGKREAIIRRADLGAQGIYYRALVGPFASAEEAAAMCSNLKAAGGYCIVQKN
jgi:SPOR domain